MISVWVVVAMIAYILAREIMHARERKDLYDRLMAGSLEDYKGHQDDGGPPKPVENIIKKRMREAKTEYIKNSTLR